MRSWQATVGYRNVEYGDEGGQTEIRFCGDSGATVCAIFLLVVKSEVKAATGNLMFKP